MTNKRLTPCIVTALIATALSAPPAQAAFTVTLLQSGQNVVATGSGTINTTDLTVGLTPVNPPNPEIFPMDGALLLGPMALQTAYHGFAGPTSFGSGDVVFGNAVGEPLGIQNTRFVQGTLFLPADYVSGSPLMNTTTWTNQTLSSLRVTPGTYVWTWGSGANADSFTLKAGAAIGAAVPEPATLALFALGLVGLGLSRRRLAS